jgi:hypothetical protein
VRYGQSWKSNGAKVKMTRIADVIAEAGPAMTVLRSNRYRYKPAKNSETDM